MGMYDEIKCEYTLPDVHMQQHTFQSKSLDAAMQHYTITADGKLIHHTYDLVAVPEEEKRHKFHIFNAIPAGDVEVPYHGDIYFYDFEVGHGGNLIEYQCRFTHGRVEWIKRLEPTNDPTS